ESQISVFLICANRLVVTPEVGRRTVLRFMLLKPPSPREARAKSKPKSLNIDKLLFVDAR
ncbi:hypothetical protein, partial [Cloacibacillus evryensis]|uniref:hypothetical protein n=1 Tax=Cloacibacillus evryensis TaxID=508460 RepID=UPI0026DEF46C